MSFETFGPDILATLIGGIILALLFFLSREKFFPLPNITGQWRFEMTIVASAYNPYKGMVLRYVAMLWREGNRIEGSVEKIYERSTAREHHYVGKERTRGQVEGYIEKNYFSKDRIFLHIVEDGEGRESTTFHELLVDSDSKMIGTFNSMVADQSGDITWQRDPF